MPTITKNSDPLSFAEKSRDWMSRAFLGLVHSLELNLSWLLGYGFLAGAALVLHARFFGPILWQHVVLVLLSWLWMLGLIWGWHIDRENRRRVISKVIMVGAVLLLCLTILLLSLEVTQFQSELFTASVQVGMVAWLVASLIILGVVFFAGTAFNPDFASLKAFAFDLFRLEIVSNVFLFLVAAQNLLFWPEFFRTSLQQEVGSLTDVFVMLNAPAPGQIPLDTFLGVIGGLVALWVLSRVIFVLYTMLAYRFLHHDSITGRQDTFSLFLNNLGWRILGKGKALWPTPLHDSNNVREVGAQPLLQDFNLISSFAAISLIFGLWAPLAITDGSSGAGSSRFLALVVLIFYLAGGIDVWLSTVEVVSTYGTGYTVGHWLGSLPLYFLTTLLPVLAVTDLFQLGLERGSSGLLAGFALFYRSSVAVLTLFLSTWRSTTGGRMRSRNIRIGLVAVSAIVLSSLTAQAARYLLGLESWAWGIQWIALPVLALIFIVLPRLWPYPPMHRRGAQLVASSSLALAPLLFSTRVRQPNWSPQGFVDMVVENAGISPEPLQLRSFIVGSEDEVAFEVLDRLRSQQRGPIDFVITDLQTAIAIMGTYEAEKRRTSFITQFWAWFSQRVRGQDTTPTHSYRIISTIGAVTWRNVEIAAPRDSQGSERRFVLDTGFLRYAPAFLPTRPSDHPSNLNRNPTQYCRLASSSVVADYALHRSQQVEAAFLPEPHFSWLARKMRDGFHVKSSVQVIYVLMERYQEKGPPLVGFNWRRTMFEVVREGQELAQNGQIIVDHERLQQLHDFLQRATDQRLDLSLADLHVGLCRSYFGVDLPRGEYLYPLIRADIKKNELIPPEELRSLTSRRRIIRALARKGLADAYFVDRQRDSRPGREAKPYLVDLAMITLADYPGQLAALLRRAKAAGIDLALLASVNLGESVLVYMLNRRFIPSQLDQGVGPLTVSRTPAAIQKWDKWLSGLRRSHVDVNEIQAAMFAIPHRAGGLLKIVKPLRGKKNGPVNIEQAFAFPRGKSVAVALLLVRPGDWSQLLLRYGVRIPETGPSKLRMRKGQVFLASNVQIDDSKLEHEKHRQFVAFVFDAEVPLNRGLQFSCDGLSNWTFTRGAIEQWDAEIDFEQIRLLVPTEMNWRLRGSKWAIVRWFADLPGIGSYLKREVAGMAGSEAYHDEKRWRMKVVK
jgi:hypothetical protein